MVRREGKDIRRGMTDEYERYKAAQAARWLDSVARAGRRLAVLRDEIDERRADAEGVRAIAYDGMPNGSPRTDSMEAAVARLDELIRDYVAEEAGYVAMQRDAHERLRGLDPACSECLTRRYLLGWKWERVCVEMGYSWDGMMSLRRRALSEAYGVMPHEWRDPTHPAI